MRAVSPENNDATDVQRKRDCQQRAEDRSQQSVYRSAMHTKWCHHWELHHTAHKMMSSLSITSHCTQTAVITEHYITIHIKRCSHCALHHTAHKTMASLRITSHCTQKGHGALHHTAHRMMSSLIITSHCTQNDGIIEDYITRHTNWRRHKFFYGALHHTAHRMMSLLIITSHCSQKEVTTGPFNQPCARRFNIASAMHTSF